MANFSIRQISLADQSVDDANFIISDANLSGADQAMYQIFFLSGAIVTAAVTTLTVAGKSRIPKSNFPTSATTYLNIWFRKDGTSEESLRVPYTLVRT